MSHRLSCLSMDFGLHLIRAITSFISSVFASRFNNSAGNRDSQDSFCKDSSCSQSSSSSMRSTSFGLLSSFSPSYTIVAYDNNGRSSQSTAPTIILTTPSGHRHRYDVRNKQRRSRHQSYLCPFDNDRDDCQIDHHNKLSSRISNFNLSSNSDSALSTPEDEDQITIRQQTMAKKVKVTEKELRHLNHKIEKLLVKLEEEYETEMATSPDEECVICISAKATMQTFPCGHRVVCRKCFVKTIQMVVSQRMLPLRCVICRAKVLRLTTGSGFPSNGNSSGGYMRTNSKNEFREKMCSAHVLRPNSFLAPFPCSTVPFGSRNLESESDSLNEVLQKHDGLCELRLENIDYWLGLSSPENEPPSPYSQTDPDEMIPNVSVRDNLYEQFNRLTCSNEAYFGNLSVFWSHDAPKKAKKHRLIAHRVSVQWPHYRKQQFRSDRASRNQKILDNNHKIVRSSLSLLPRMEWQDQKTESKSSHIRNNSLESCKSGEFDASLRAIKSNDYPIPLYNPLLSAYLPLWYPSRTKKYSRHLQYRHLFGGKQTFQLHSAQQPQFMNIFGGHQNQFSPRDSFATNRIKNVRYWQRWPHSLLLPIREEDEDQFNASACEAEQQELIKNFISLSESSESIAISQIFERNSIRINQQALQKAQKPNVMPALICNFDDSKTVNCKKSKQETQHIQTKDKQHKQLYQRQIKMYTNVRMRKSRSESFLASNKRYRRLRENKSNTESESESPTDDCINSEFRYLLASKQKNASNQTSTALYDQNIRDDDDNFSERASFKPVKSSSLTSLISNKIQESFKMFRSFKLR